MLPSTAKPLAALPLSALLIALVLTGCSAEPLHALRDSKSQVQLVRNSAADLVPADVIASVTNSGDTSTSCGEGDPYRRWKSTAIIALTPAAVPNVDALYSDLVDTYLADGWVSDKSTETSATLKQTTKRLTLVVTSLTVPDKASLRVEVAGDCVLTGGKDSDEVKGLEESRTTR